MSHIQNVPAQKMPEWLSRILANGYEIYIATSERLLPWVNTRPFGVNAHVFTLESPAHQMFHEAYLLSNSLSFRSPDLKMPNWVLIDCALMQTAIIGFMKPAGQVPEKLLHFFHSDRFIDIKQLTHIPISGQIASPATDGQSLVGFSLFSLASFMGDEKGLGLYTKALAYEVHGHERYPVYYGIAQYDNRAIRIHGRFTPKMEIYRPIVPLHPKKDMTFIYKMNIDFDPFELDALKPLDAIEPDFWLRADDLEGKQRIQQGIAAGKHYIIAPPYSVARDDGLYLPIIEEE